jgi:hypothetical protein
MLKSKLWKGLFFVFALTLVVSFATTSYAKNNKDKDKDKDEEQKQEEKWEDADKNEDNGFVSKICNLGNGHRNKFGLCKDKNKNKPPLVYIFATKYSIKEGKSTTLYLKTKRVDSCTASGGWSGSKDSNVREKVSPATTTTYTITCNNAFGSFTDSVEIWVNHKKGTTTPPVVTPPATTTLSFNGSPLSILNGATSTLTWNSANATSCTASNGWSGAKSLSGTQVVSPSATTTYKLTCSGAGGTASSTVVIGVTASSSPATSTPTIPTLTFNGSPLSITDGATSTLTWSSTDTTSCTASNGWAGSKALSGNQIVAPTSTTTYALSCTGAGGTASSTVTIGVTASSSPATSTPPVDLTNFLLSEVNYKTSSGGEWVEIHNGTANPVTMEGWTISDAASSDVIATTTVPAGGFVIITGSTTLAASLPGVTVVTLGNTSIGSGLNDTGDAVFLKDKNGATIDSMSYGDNATGFSSGLGVGLTSSLNTLKRISLSSDTNTAADWATTTAQTPGS